MAPEELAALPALPAAGADWEDLLVRLEIMPRALASALEERPAEEGHPIGTLMGLLATERAVGRWLETAAFGSADGIPDDSAGSADPVWLADRFAAVRARNFAMVQRRGVDVWAWKGDLVGTALTVYQLLTGLVRSDAAALAGLREARPTASGVTAC